jgi:predicted permease
VHSVTPGYLETVGLPLLRGRWVERADGAETTPVAVVSEEFAARVFPGEDPMGQRFEVTLDFGFGAPTWTVVGVVGDVKRSLTDVPASDFYIPLPQFGPGSLTVAMRTAGVAVPLATIRDVVRGIDASLPIRDYETVEDAIHRQVAPTRFYLVAMMTFAGLAVLLACVGLYGVVAYVVSRRTREIGVRIALGARGREVVPMVLAQGLAPAVLGVGLGLVLALALGRAAESLLFEVSPRDPLILASVSVLLLVAASAAVLVPAVRASRVDPVIALKG